MKHTNANMGSAGGSGSAHGGTGTPSNRKCNIAASFAGNLRDAQPCPDWCVTAQCVLAIGPRFGEPMVTCALVFPHQRVPQTVSLQHTMPPVLSHTSFLKS